MTKVWVDLIPLWMLFFATVAIVVASVEAGRYLAIRRLKNTEKPADSPVSAVIGSTLGLLAFLLAFTFGIAAARFDARRELLLEEVNAINTCYLRAGMIPNQQQQAVRALLRDYVHQRAELSRRPDQLPKALAQFVIHANESLDKLWELAEQVAEIDRNSEMYSLFVDSVNTVIDSHATRLTVGLYRIPGSIWLALYAVSILSMFAVGYHFGISGGRDLFINLFLAISFSVVIVLIADLDNGTTGNLSVSQQPMYDLDEKLHSKK
jgi:hypothetical protein